jgi:hypothetical protein
MAANAGANTPLVGRGEASSSSKIDDRFGHWPLALEFENLVA